MSSGDVFRLTAVCGQVKELGVRAVVFAEQFPFPVANGKVREIGDSVIRITIRRSSKKDRLAARGVRLPGQHSGERLAIEVCIEFWRDLREFQQ